MLTATNLGLPDSIASRFSHLRPSLSTTTQKTSQMVFVKPGTTPIVNPLPRPGQGEMVSWIPQGETPWYTTTPAVVGMVAGGVAVLGGLGYLLLGRR